MHDCDCVYLSVCVSVCSLLSLSLSGCDKLYFRTASYCRSEGYIQTELPFIPLQFLLLLTSLRLHSSLYHEFEYVFTHIYNMYVCMNVCACVFLKVNGHFKALTVHTLPLRASS